MKISGLRPSNYRYFTIYKDITATLLLRFANQGRSPEFFVVYIIDEDIRVRPSNYRYFTIYKDITATLLLRFANQWRSPEFFVVYIIDEDIRATPLKLSLFHHLQRYYSYAATSFCQSVG